VNIHAVDQEIPVLKIFHVIGFWSNLILKITDAYENNLTQKCFYPVHDEKPGKHNSDLLGI